MYKISKEMEQSAAIFHAVYQQQQRCTKIFAFRFHDIIFFHRTSSVPWLVATVGGISKRSPFTQRPSTAETSLHD